MKIQNPIYRNGSVEPTNQRIERLQKRVNQLLNEIKTDQKSKPDQTPRSLNIATLTLTSNLNLVQIDPMLKFFKDNLISLREI